METETHTDAQHGYGGGWAGPIAAIIAIAVALLLLGWLEIGLMETLLHPSGG